MSAVNATFTSVWDGGTMIESPSRANLVTRTIELELVDNDEVETLDREFVTIDGKEYSVMNESVRANYSENEQNSMFFYR